MKICKTCKTYQTEYHRNKRMKSGYSNICKKCVNKIHKKYVAQVKMKPGVLAELKAKYNPDNL